MRHAKSDWSGAQDSDFDRPLNRRGIRAARNVGCWLRENDFQPAAVLSSSSVRTRQTVDHLGLGCDDPALPNRTRWLDALYLADSGTVLSAITAAHSMSTPLLVVGHNPGMEDLVTYLAPELLKRGEYRKLMPTGAIYVLEMMKNRGGPTPSTVRFLSHTRPRQLE